MFSSRYWNAERESRGKERRPPRLWLVMAKCLSWRILFHGIVCFLLVRNRGERVGVREGERERGVREGGREGWVREGGRGEGGREGEG